METINEDYVSYEIAELLKEKGFDEHCRTYYQDERFVDDVCTKYYQWNSKSPFGQISAPTHQMTMKWLREVHHIEISITFGFPFIDGKQQYKYFWSVVKVYNNHLEYPMDDPNNATYNEEIADSYEQAVEAGIKYCLKNLI